jgi:Tol biopolymer transport system component
LLAYSKNGNLFVANADGSGSRKLSSVPGDISSVSWSADDESLRFDSSEIVGQHQMWEVSSSGGNLHRLLAGWHNPPDECCGHWTADGQQFLFQSGGQIWALAKPGLLSPQPKPVQLTFSPMSLSTPLPGKDGKRVFVVGQLNRGELMRYDLKLGEFSPFLSGISAEYVDFSRDGKWVAYVTYPEGALWRSKTDGSERLQLTYPPTYPMLPRWSPDGTEILFFEFRQDSNLAKIYAISPNGGNSHELMPTDSGQQVDPNWSPDGGKVVFGGNSSDTGSSIRLFDVKMGTISSLPQSQGFFSPRWSPHGEYICALSSDSTRLVLFDLRTKKWTDLAQGSFGWLNWSNDGEYIYVLDQSGSGTVRRVRLKDHHVDPVVQLTKFKTTGRYRGALALAPDNSPLLLRDSGTQDVYALNWVAP